MKNLLTLRTLAALVAFTSLVHADGDWSVAKAVKPRMAVFAEDVTVDGVRRPDLGRALADSLTTALLRRGQVRVFNLSTTETTTGTQTLSKPGDAVHAERLDDDLDYLLSFNLFSMGSEHRLTVKKTRVSNSELIDSWPINHYGRVSELFGLVPRIVDRVDPKPVVHGFPVTQSPSELRPHVRPENNPHFASDYANPASPGYDPIRLNAEQNAPAVLADLAHVPKALVYQEVGSIAFINDLWKFAIVRPHQGVRLNANDPLHVLYEEGDVYANLRVTNVERAGTVADYGGITPRHHPLMKGDKVYGWATPRDAAPAKTPRK